MAAVRVRVGGEDLAPHCEIAGGRDRVSRQVGFEIGLEIAAHKGRPDAERADRNPEAIRLAARLAVVQNGYVAPGDGGEAGEAGGAGQDVAGVHIDAVARENPARGTDSAGTGKGRILHLDGDIARGTQPTIAAACVHGHAQFARQVRGGKGRADRTGAEADTDVGQIGRDDPVTFGRHLDRMRLGVRIRADTGHDHTVVDVDGRIRIHIDLHNARTGRAQQGHRAENGARVQVGAVGNRGVAGEFAKVLRRHDEGAIRADNRVCPDRDRGLAGDGGDGIAGIDRAHAARAAAARDLADLAADEGAEAQVIQRGELRVLADGDARAMELGRAVEVDLATTRDRSGQRRLPVRNRGEGGRGVLVVAGGRIVATLVRSRILGDRVVDRRFGLGEFLFLIAFFGVRSGGATDVENPEGQGQPAKGPHADRNDRRVDHILGLRDDLEVIAGLDRAVIADLNEGGFRQAEVIEPDAESRIANRARAAGAGDRAVGHGHENDIPALDGAAARQEGFCRAFKVDHIGRNAERLETERPGGPDGQAVDGGVLKRAQEDIARGFDP